MMKSIPFNSIRNNAGIHTNLGEAIPFNFDPESYPIIARHWFGIEPNSCAVGEVLSDAHQVRATWWRLRRQRGVPLPAEHGLIISKGGRV